MAKRLTDKEKEFLRVYFETGDGAASVRAAGYNSKNPAVYASQLLQKPKIVAELNRMRKPVEKALQVDREWVIAKLIYEVQDAADANAQSRIQALDKLSKILGLQSMTHKHEGKLDIAHHAEDARGKLSSVASRIFELKRDRGVSQLAH